MAPLHSWKRLRSEPCGPKAAALKQACRRRANGSFQDRKRSTLRWRGRIGGSRSTASRLFRKDKLASLPNFENRCIHRAVRSTALSEGATRPARERVPGTALRHSPIGERDMNLHRHHWLDVTSFDDGDGLPRFRCAICGAEARMLAWGTGTAWWHSLKACPL